MLFSQGTIKCNSNFQVQVVYKMHQIKSIRATPEGHPRKPMGRSPDVDDGSHDGSADVEPPLISKCSWAPFSLISHIFPFSLFFSYPSDILNWGTAGHEWLLINRCHLYAVLHSLSFPIMLVPHTHSRTHTDSQASQLMMFGGLPCGQTCCWVYLCLRRLGHVSRLGGRECGGGCRLEVRF